MDSEKLIERLYQHDKDYGEGRTQDFFRVCLDCKDAATALEQLQAENDRLKETISCYCDMCIEQDGVLWCQSCDEKCDYCIHPKEE